ncbi:MAG: hypothetical protein GIKADHBN_03245 [Phycisphaerales bacterium]|nr:hypothetical protein [Phycisphaerales bacterium]
MPQTPALLRVLTVVSAGILPLVGAGCRTSDTAAEPSAAGSPASSTVPALDAPVDAPADASLDAGGPVEPAEVARVEPQVTPDQAPVAATSGPAHGTHAGSEPAPAPASSQASGTSIAAAAAWEWSVIGSSREGRAIEATTFGSGPLRVYIVGNIHGDEIEGLGTMDVLPWILGHGPVGALATTRIVRDVNPDGTAARTRGNAAGRDLNRNWPATNFMPRASTGPAPLSEPETETLHEDLVAVDPHLVIVFHSSPRGPFVNYDGPAVGIAAAFVDAAIASESRWTLVPDMGYPTPGSLGSYVGVDRQVPILTIEFRRGQSPELVLAAAVEGVTAAVERATLAK